MSCLEQIHQWGIFWPLQWHQCLHGGYSWVSLSKSSHKLSADSFAVVAADTDDDHNDMFFGYLVSSGLISSLLIKHRSTRKATLSKMAWNEPKHQLAVVIWCGYFEPCFRPVYRISCKASIEFPIPSEYTSCLFKNLLISLINKGL